MKILLLSPRVPDRPRRGFEVSCFHYLRGLSPRHQVTLVAFDSPAVPPPVASLPNLRMRLAPRSALAATVGMLAAIRRGLPAQVGLYDVKAMRRLLADTLGAERFDVIHVQLARMAGVFEEALALAGHDGPNASTPRILEMIDALSLNMARRRDFDRGVTRLAAAFEAKRLRAYEAALCRRFHRVLVVSPVDAKALGQPRNVVIHAHGVDISGMSAAQRQSGRILFGGNLGYFPNADAAVWFAKDILPRIRQIVPAANLVIAGTRPTRAVRALADPSKRIELRADVPDMAAEIRQSAICVAPLRAGSGQPLKVLEAMAQGTPVVATATAVAGLAVRNQQHLMVANSVESFAAMSARLLTDSNLAQRIGAEAHRFVEAQYTWATSVERLERLYEEVRRER